MLFKSIIVRGASLHVVMVVPLALLLACGAAFAQEITGGIYGKVTDEQGLVVPGATVTITSPQHIGKEVRVTTEEGTYRVQRLTPSNNYTVLVELVGFKTITHREVIVRAGQFIAVDAQLSAGAVVENITVVGRAPLLDVKSSASLRTLESAQMENIPLGRDITSLLNSLPGVLDAGRGGQQTVHGSDPRGNVYTIDGANANDTTVGTQLTSIPIDMIEEVQLTTSGMPAEFGNAHGGVFNIVTKSGGNDFHGTASFYYEGEDLEANNVSPERAEEIGTGTSTVKDQEIGGTFGGPIKKDKIWFFANFRLLDSERRQPILPDQKIESDQQQSFLKLTWDIRPGSRLHGSLTTRSSSRFPANISVGRANSPETWSDSKSDAKILNIASTHLWGADTILDLQFHKVWKGTSRNTPNNPGSKVGLLDVATQVQTGGITSGLPQTDCRCTTGFKTDLSHFRENWAGGSHEIKGGFFVDFPTFDRSQSYPNGEDVQQRLFDGAPYRVTLEWYPVEDRLALDRYGLYLQDQWTIGRRATLNLGVRWVTQEGWIPAQSRGGGRWFRRESFSEIRDVINLSNIEPRLGLSYGLGEEQRSSLKVSYGRYYRNLLTQDTLPGAPSSGGTETYGWNDLNGDFVFQDGERGDLVGSELNPNIRDNSNFVDPDLTNSYVDIFNVALDHELANDFVLSVGGIFKRKRNIIEDTRLREGGDQQNPFNDYRPLEVVNPFDDSPLTIFALRPEFLGSRSRRFLTNPDFAGKLYQNYNGLEITAKRRFRDGWQLLASYILSEAEGNISNDFNGTTTYNRVYNDPNSLINAEGNVSQDATHAFKLQGTYTFPYDILVSGFYQATTGFPLLLFREQTNTSQGVYIARFFQGCPATGTGTGAAKGDGGGAGGCRPLGPWPLGTQGIVVEGNIDANAVPIGTFRLDPSHKLDLRVEKQFPLGNGKRLGIIFDVFNVANASRVRSIQTNFLDQPNFLRAASIESPRILRIGVRFQF
jgi:outer membrane receptor protein involved in Fe transport